MRAIRGLRNAMNAESALSTAPIAVAVARGPEAVIVSVCR